MPQFTNQATLNYNGLAINSNIAVGEIIDTLSMNKTAVDNQYRGTDSVAYVVNLNNSGTAPLTNLTLTDDLGGYTFGTNTVYPLNYVPGSINYFVNGVLQNQPTVTEGPPLTITGITVPAGATATVAYETVTTEYAPQATGSSIDNTVTATGTGLTAPISAAGIAVPIDAPDVRITKSITPNPVTENSQVTYSFLIENYGNTPLEATENATVTDTFNPILTNISATLNGAEFPVTTGYTYDQSTGAFSTVAGQLAIPAATYTTDPVTGAITTVPGQTTLTVTGTI